MFDKTYSSEVAAAASQFQKERAFWLKKLSGDLAKNTFPFDHDTPNKKREMFTIPIRFPGEVVSKLLWISNESDAISNRLKVNSSIR